MRRNKKPHPIIENQTVTSIAAEGKAIVRYNDKVIFVPLLSRLSGRLNKLQKRKQVHGSARHSFSRIILRCAKPLL
jgi:23S rRNA (uracil1939-C5)-methyltransferase